MRVLVTGAGGPAGRSLGEQLVARGVAVVGCDMQPQPSSTFPVHEVLPAQHPRFVPELEHLARREGVDLVVPTVSEELVVLAGLGPVPGAGRGVSVAVSPLGAVVSAADKLLTCRALRAHGVAVPRFARGPEVLTHGDAVARLGWPYLSKPRVGRGGRGVRVHRPDRDAATGYGEDVLLQEFVTGTEYAVDLYVGGAGDPVVVVLEKTRLAQGEVGNAVGVRRVSAPDVAETAASAAAALGLTGAVDVDVRLRSDRTSVVLEINARFGAHSAHVPELLDALLAEHGRPAHLVG